MPDIGFSADTLTRTPEPALDDGDHDRFAHYAPKDAIADALVFGTPLQALCGKIWVPSRDPSRYPVCPTCAEIHASLPPGEPPDA